MWQERIKCSATQRPLKTPSRASGAKSRLVGIKKWMGSEKVEKCVGTTPLMCMVLKRGEGMRQ
jgi:hypothetical protein